MRALLTLGSIAAVIAIAAVGLSFDRAGTEGTGARSAPAFDEKPTAALAQRSAVEAVSSRSPFAVAAEREVDASANSTERVPTRSEEANAIARFAESDDAGIDVSDIALGAWSDEAFAEQLARLRADPALLERLMEAFRVETDPRRATRLASLLGKTGHPDLAALGADMIASGNATSKEAALTLLQRIQHDSDAARETIIDMLSGESEPGTLVRVMDALSVPAKATPEQVAALENQLMPLAQHESVALRRHALSVLARWSAGENVTPVLRAGLSDSDVSVRSAATYAFVDYPAMTAEVRHDLLERLEDPREDRSVRSGAMLALSRTALDPEEMARLKAARRELRRRPARP